MQEKELETSDDGWPWPSLLMLGLHVLHLSEEQFWKLTPKKFSALIGAYREFKAPVDDEGEDTTKSKKKSKSVPTEETYIDEAPSWW